MPFESDHRCWGPGPGRRRRNPPVDLYRAHLVGRALVIFGHAITKMEFGTELCRLGRSPPDQTRRSARHRQDLLARPRNCWCIARRKAACCTGRHALAQAAHTAEAWIAGTTVRRTCGWSPTTPCPNEAPNSNSSPTFLHRAHRSNGSTGNGHRARAPGKDRTGRYIRWPCRPRVPYCGQRKHVPQPSTCGLRPGSWRLTWRQTPRTGAHQTALGGRPSVQKPT